LARGVIYANDAPIPVLAPGNGKTKPAAYGGTRARTRGQNHPLCSTTWRLINSSSHDLRTHVAREREAFGGSNRHI
jgi:hypothetical protein